MKSTVPLFEVLTFPLRLVVEPISVAPLSTFVPPEYEFAPANVTGPMPLISTPPVPAVAPPAPVFESLVHSGVVRRDGKKVWRGGFLALGLQAHHGLQYRQCRVCFT